MPITTVAYTAGRKMVARKTRHPGTRRWMANATINGTTTRIGTESAKIRLFLQGDAEDRVAPEELEVVETDPLGGSDAVPAREGVVEDARERIGDEDADERHRRGSVEQAPCPLGAMGPAPCSRCVRDGQGFSDLRPLSTFCIAFSGVVLPENAAWSCW